MAFVTRKMFPENKWIPYRLQWVDLSHNHMPVLTKELLIGTKHLRHLNVSANMLNDVRDGVISNLAALEVLDISHNFLTDKVRPEKNLCFHTKTAHVPLSRKLLYRVGLVVWQLGWAATVATYCPSRMHTGLRYHNNYLANVSQSLKILDPSYALLESS